MYFIVGTTGAAIQLLLDSEEAPRFRHIFPESVADWHQGGHPVRKLLKYSWMDNCLAMGIRLLPDGDFSISERHNFCKVSSKVWLFTL